MKNEFIGSCQCRHVRYKVTGKPLTLFNCHCKECQKQSSSAFGMALWVKKESIEILSGKLKTWVRNLPNGDTMECDFCPECGTRIFHRHTSRKDIISIKPGTLDDTFWLKPAGHVWVQDAQKWISFTDGGLVYNKDPDDYEKMILKFSSYIE